MSDVTLKDLQSDLADVLSVVSFVKDNAVTKDEFEGGLQSVRNEMHEGLQSVRNEMHEGLQSVRNEMHEMKSEITSHIDSFIVLNQKLDVELVSMRSKYERLEEHINTIAKHLNVELS